MEMREQTLVKECIGRNLVTATGDKVGTIKAVYVDDHTSLPQWFAVGTGWFGNHISFVPIEGTNLAGLDVASPYTKDTVKRAPHVEPNGHLTPDEQRSLYDYYGLDDTDKLESYDDELRKMTRPDATPPVSLRTPDTPGAPESVLRDDERS